MKRRAAPPARLPGRWLRGLWPDRNPLRRTCDRAEAVIVAGLLAAFLIGGSLAGLFAGQWACIGAGLRAERAQQAVRHRVAAVLLASAPAAAPTWMRQCYGLGRGPGGPRRMGRSAPARLRRPQVPGPAAPCWCGPTPPVG